MNKQNRCYERAAWRLIRKSSVSHWTLVFSALAAFGVWFQWRTLSQTLTETRGEFKAQQRAYIVLGSADGTLAKFGPIIDKASGKRIIILHAFNAGQTTARHFSVRAFANTAAKSPLWLHRHRWAGPYGTMVSEWGQQMDLGAKAEHFEYLTDPKYLWTAQQLKVPNSLFNVIGEFEYCDIFGGYHCESFALEYRPPPVDDFVGSDMKLPCYVEKDINTAFYERKGQKEIQPCEQPDEPEHYNMAEFTAPNATATATR
jgi:hypothetical protein